MTHIETLEARLVSLHESIRELKRQHNAAEALALDLRSQAVELDNERVDIAMELRAAKREAIQRAEVWEPIPRVVLG